MELRILFPGWKGKDRRGSTSTSPHGRQKRQEYPNQKMPNLPHPHEISTVLDRMIIDGPDYHYPQN